jgi:NAD(P)H-flavin reductase
LGTRLVRVLLERPRGFAFLPGQYLLINEFAFAIASAPSPGEPLELFIRLPDEGGSLHAMEALIPGHELAAWSLAGRGLVLAPGHPRIRFFATGTAVAPFRSFLLSPAFRQCEMQAEVWIGLRDEYDLPLIEGLDRIPGVEIHATLSRASDSWTGRRGRLDDWVDELPAKFFAEPSLYSLCGQPEFVLRVGELLTERGVESTLMLAPN